MTEKFFAGTIFNDELYHVASQPAIVITHPWEELKEEEKEQLSKIAEALRQRVNPRLGLASFKVVFAPTLDLSTWSDKPAKLVYFGQPVKGLTNYEVIKAGQTSMVLSESLSSLLQDEVARAKLWLALKQLFAS